MKIPLSPRLQACAELVTPGSRIADIGCDHGYLSIYLLANGIASFCIASDVRPGPLDSARRNAQKFQVSNRIAFFLSDGVKNIPQDFDTLICAGMGADTMIHILTDAPWLQNSQYRLILQCQSKTSELRQYLSDSGWHIRSEFVLRDGRFLYTVMHAEWQPNCPPLTPAQCYFPPAMLEHPSPETAEYYRRTVNLLRLAISARGDKADPMLRQILQNLEDLALESNMSFLKEE